MYTVEYCNSHGFVSNGIIDKFSSNVRYMPSICDPLKKTASIFAWVEKNEYPDDRYDLIIHDVPPLRTTNGKCNSEYVIININSVETKPMKYFEALARFGILFKECNSDMKCNHSNPRQNSISTCMYSPTAQWIPCISHSFHYDKKKYYCSM